MSGSPDALPRAYSLLEIKAIDAEKRIIEGFASTPELDRQGDSMDPAGAKFSIPLPLLWQHKSDKPIGKVIAANVTDAGIYIRAKIESNVLPFIDEAWALIKSGLVGGLSIDWKPLAPPVFKNGAARYAKWEWLALSTVTVPANQSASITLIKAIDSQVRAASGDGPAPKQVGTPGVTGAVVRLAMKDASTTMKTITDQIKEFEATRAAKAGEQKSLMDAAAEKGETLDEANGQKYDGLATEIKSIDQHLVRLRDMEALNKAAAQPVNGENPAAAAAARGGSVISVKSNVPPGIGLARAVICKMAAYMERGAVTPLQLAKHYYPDDARLHLHLKATIAAGTTTDATWASPLVDQATLGSEFIELLRKDTIIGKFGTDGIPSLRRLPFNIRIPSMTGGFTGYWVGEGAAKPVSKGAFDAVTVPYTKAAAIAVITKELARFSNPAAEGIVRDQLRAAVIERLDTDLVDPDIAAVSGVKPASLTNGVTALSSAGTSADNIRTDIQNLLEQFILNNMNPTGLVLIMPNTLALAASIMVNSLGQREFPDLTMRGGSILGIPVITSQYAASSGANGNMVIAVNANDVGLADDGEVSIDVSGEASLEMSDAPTATSATPTAASLVSMFQTNSLAILAERFIHWKKLRSTAVVWMDDVNWGAIGSPS